MPAVLDVARTQIGYREQPGNVTKYGAAFGVNGVSWCLEFVWWCFEQCGVDVGRLVAKTASVDAFWRAGVAKRLNTSHPVPGDVVIFHFPGEHPGGNHTGLLVGDNGNGTNTTIEGNTGSQSQTNGDGVWQRTRSKGLVLGYLHIPVAAAPVSPPSPVDYRKLAAALLAGEMGAQPDLNHGTTDLRVVVLQRSLNLVLPDAHLAEDGVYGDATYMQVARWQRFTNGLPPQGSNRDPQGDCHAGTRFFLCAALANIRDGKA